MLRCLHYRDLNFFLFFYIGYFHLFFVKMGVRNLMQVIKDHAENAIEPKGWSTLSGKILTIDVSTFAYRYVKGWCGVPDQPKKNNVAMGHVHGFLQLLEHLAKFKIKAM